MLRSGKTRACILAAAITVPSAAFAQSETDLAKQSQNPVANLISLPFQNNTYFGIGPDDDTANILNIQPVIPVALGDWNLINRTIVPLIYLPDLTNGLPDLPEGIEGGSEFGLGDINYTGWLSPVDAQGITWGVGPSISIPSATDDVLGSEKWSIGPSVVVAAQPGPFVTGGLVRHEDTRQNLIAVENRMYGCLPPCKQVFLFAQACVVGCCYVSGLVGPHALGPR